MFKLDRYILRQIIFTLIFTIIALCVIFIVVNLMETLDKFIDNNVSLEIIIKYYIIYLPEILKILTPVSVLIACLLITGKLSNNNELTAMRSGGMSLYRIIIPMSLIGIILSFGQYIFNGWIVPAANEEKARLEHIYLNKHSGDDFITNIAFRSSPERNVLIQYYDANNKTAQRVIIEDYIYTFKENKVGAENSNITNKKNKSIPYLKSRIEAKQLVWNSENHSWDAVNGIIKTIENDETIKLEKFDKMPIDININYKQLAKMNKKTDQLTFTEMQDYITLLKTGGKDIRQMEIDYRSEQALPLANFIVILFAMPFASVKKRGGLAVQIAAAMVIAFSYLICFQLSKPIGLSIDISPFLVGWSSNILFFILGIITILKTRT